MFCCIAVFTGLSFLHNSINSISVIFLSLDHEGKPGFNHENHITDFRMIVYLDLEHVKKEGVPVFHAGEFASRLFQGDVVAVGERAQAACNQRHGPESGPGRTRCVRTGCVLLARLSGPWRLEPMICASEGNLHS